MKDYIIFEFILLASAAALVISAGKSSHSVVDDTQTGFEHPEDRAAFLKAARDFWHEPNNEAIYRTLQLIGTEPGKGGYSIEIVTKVLRERINFV